MHYLTCTSPYLTCVLFSSFPDLGLDIQDDLGRHEVGFVENTEKLPINEGNGCRFKCEFKINKVSCILSRL